MKTNEELNNCHLWEMLNEWTPLYTDITKIIDGMFWDMYVLEVRRAKAIRRTKRDNLRFLKNQMYNWNRRIIGCISFIEWVELKHHKDNINIYD